MGHGSGDVSDDFEDEDMGDPFTDVTLTNESDEEEMDESQDEEMDESQDDLEESDMMDQGYGMDQASKRHKDLDGHDEDNLQPNVQKDLPETIRRRIRAEMRLQLEAKQKARQAKKKQQEAQKKAKQSKKMQEKQQAKKQSKKMQEAYNFYASKFNESVARTNKLKNMLSEAVRRGRALNSSSARNAESDKLRAKLAETNLFNTKLLYANKVLQNESFTKSQKAEIIERLDEARSDREVKLVFESLVRTLNSASRRRMDEWV